MKNIMIAAALLMLTGCHGAAEIEGDGYRVRTSTDGHHHHGGPRHCPPGHAKKGWC